MDKIGYSLGHTTSLQELQSWEAFPTMVVLQDGSSVHGMKLGDTISRQRLVERWLSISYGVPVPDAIVFDGAKTVVNRVLQDQPPSNLDPFYGPVILDPNNPGHWIQQPYTPAEMKPKLEQYSADTRMGYETDGVIIHPPTGGDYGAVTTRDARALISSAYLFLSDPANAGKTMTVKLMRIKTVSPPTYGAVQFVHADLAKITEIKNATDKWGDLCFAQESTLFNMIEAGTTTTKDQIDATYLTMRTNAFPIAP